MPRSARQLKEIREQSRTRILEAALGLFARHGYERTSVRMIAEAAGVAQGLLYNYYDGKEALLRAILQRSLQDVEESFLRAAGGKTPRERIERLIGAAFDIVQENLPFWRLTYQLRMQPGVAEGLSLEVRESSEAIRRELEELLRPAGATAPAVDARLLFAAIDGAAQHYAIDPERYPLKEVAGALIRRLPLAAADAAGGAEPEER